MAFHSDDDDDAFDITSTFLDVPVERDAIKARKDEKHGSNVAVMEALRLAKKNREKKRQEREKRRKRKRGEEVSEDEDEGDSNNVDEMNQDTDGADNDEDMSGESSDSDSEMSSSEKDSTAELKTTKRQNLKEKERKKQKKAKKQKKEKVMASAGTTTVPDPHKRGEFGVWVGNLAFSTTSKAIQDFFTDCGEIVRIFCPTGYDKKMNQGFAYVDFATPEAQAKAIKRSEHVLDKRNLLIKDSKNFTKTGRPKRDNQGTGTTAAANPKNLSALNAPQQHAPSSTLFVGNLSFRATTESLQTLFEECGRIRKVRMASFEDSGKCKGFAYIDFYEPESATTALNANNKRYMMGRKLRMEYASEEATKRGAPWLMRKEQGKSSNSKDMTELKVHSQKENAPLPRVERNLEVRKDTSERDGRHEHDSKRRKQRDKHIQAHQKPGAVLASKTRQKVGAVKFEGTKIKFE